jgi:hypothetical protein
MNFSNENLLIMIVLISIVIMFLTSDSICKNREQFDDSDNARRIGTFGQMGQMGQIGTFGQMGQMGPFGQIGQINSPASSEPVCDAIKCGINPPVCTQGDCIPTYSFGSRCKSKIFGVCSKWEPTKKTNPCGARGLPKCSPGTAKCC